MDHARAAVQPHCQDGRLVTLHNSGFHHVTVYRPLFALVRYSTCLLNAYRNLGCRRAERRLARLPRLEFPNVLRQRPYWLR